MSYGVEIISRGVATCERDTSKHSVCEGFNVNDRYMFERCRIAFDYSVDQHLSTGTRYMRVYDIPVNPEETEPLNFSPPFSYETIGIPTFTKCFRVLSEQSA